MVRQKLSSLKLAVFQWAGCTQRGDDQGVAVGTSYTTVFRLGAFIRLNPGSILQDEIPHQTHKNQEG